MLRTVKNSRLAQRLIPFRVSTTGSQSVLHGKDDIRSLTDNGTGDITLTHSEPFRHDAIALAFAQTSAGATGAQAYAVTVGEEATRVIAHDTAGVGAAADGVIEGVIVGPDSPTQHAAGTLQRVICTNPAPRVVAVRLTAPGTVAEGKYQVTAAAVGGRTLLSLKQPFQQEPVVLVVSDTLATTANRVSSASLGLSPNSKIVIDQFTLSSDAAAAGGAHVIIIGQDIRSITGKHRRALKGTQMKPRLIVGKVAVAAGVYSVDHPYSDLGTVLKNGTGDFTLTFEKAFQRAPVAVATSTTGVAVAVTATSTTTCTIKTTNAAGVAADASGDIQVFVYGFDYGVQS